MNIYKKFIGALVAGMTVTGSFSCIQASEQKGNMNQVAKEFSTFNGVQLNATSDVTIGADTTAPRISDIRTMVIDSKNCIVVHVEDDQTGIGYVQINSSTATRRSGDRYSADYYIEISGNGNYSIYVQDQSGNSKSETHYVTINDSKKPSLELSQTFKNGYCYLVIDADDNGSIASVTVNGSAISFDSKGEVKDYKVTESKTYTVEVKDAAGNTTTEKIDIDVNNSQPNLTVDKNFKNGKYYLTIKTSPNGNARISKLTVNNSRVSCRSNGDTIEYEVAGTGNYTVEVTDSYNRKTSKTISIDTNATSTTNNPTLSLAQKDIGGVICIAITAYPSGNIYNNALSKVTVNGLPVTLSSKGGTTEYPVSASGNYTVVATDTNGNIATQNIYVTVPTAPTNLSTSYSNTGNSSKVVFTLNKKAWLDNGKSQIMDAAPISKNGRIYIPIRYVAYALNIDSSQVIWDANAKTAIIYDGANTIKVPLGSKTMSVNGVSEAMEAAAISQNKRVYIPISQVAKAFSGVSMNWDNTKKQVTIVRH